MFILSRWAGWPTPETRKVEEGLSASTKHRGHRGAKARQNFAGAAGSGPRTPGDQCPRLPRRPGRLSRAAAVTPSGRGGKCKRCPLLSGRKVGASRGFHRGYRRAPPGVKAALCRLSRGALPLPRPQLPPSSRPSAGRSCRAAVPGRAGWRAAPALGCDLEQFHFWILLGLCWESTRVGLEEGHAAGRGPALETPSEGWASTAGCTRPTPPSVFRLPMGSTPLAPSCRSSPAATASAGAADPRRGPERRGRQQERAVKPQAGGL